MARPERNNVDYFPHPVTHGKKMSYIEKKYKNDGYAVWFKILEELGSNNYHYLDLSDEVQIMFLSDRCFVDENRLISIIEDLIRLKEFDKDLWYEHKILFNEKFIESIQDAYKKRSNSCIEKKSLLLLLDSLGIRKLGKSNPKLSKRSHKTTKDRIGKKRKEKERDARAINFLKTNYPSRYEQEFEMRYLSKILNKEKFIDDFNDVVDKEELDYTDKILFSRLGMWTRNWIENQNKFSNKNDPYFSTAPKRF